ncbi:MAG TPA: PQQ-dependent sugar dehydrogenase [Pirellulaceae bacterium]|nr:PQQ-dependent sugar dehydrogenase [Pirellulaceae bacterium]
MTINTTRLLLSGLAFGLLMTAMPIQAVELNSLSDGEQRAGWKLLFDGKTTEGWRNFAKDGISDGWKVVDGALTRAAGGAGDIVTVDKYDSFELSIEFNISKSGNSGIMFHVDESDKRAPYFTGPEIQIQDNVDGHDPQKCGWLYQLYPAQVDATKPAGQWNHLRIRITPDECSTYMNGVRYARYKKGSDDWDRRVAKSKFSKWEKFGKATNGYICLQDHGNQVAYRNIKVRRLTGQNDQLDPVDGTLAFKPAVAFPNLKWSGWEPVDAAGKVEPLRPIVLTHAGDGSDRVFVATQRGVIHVFENDQKATKTKVFLDLSKKVKYSDKQNEEGFLGLAFHPNYEENGQFFVYYTPSNRSQVAVIDRYHVSASDADQADPKSVEEVMAIEQPYWNHNGGSIAFGHDDKMYIGLGDGGAGNDPHGNGQNKGTLLGSILRIDVDHKSDGKNYAIPKDNPLVGDSKAKGEIWAQGLRNVWRLGFDRKTGDLWVSDVGQDTWEEINIVTRGGNYGWNLREGNAMFGVNGSGPNPRLTDPIWVYDHEVGKSITGGYVYRGKRVPGLEGAYLYADYITGRLWALRYDHEKKAVISNHALQSDGQAVISFGEAEDGEVYFMVVDSTGRGIHRFVPAK